MITEERGRKYYGSRQIFGDLKDQGEHISRQRVIRLMQEQELVARVRRRYKCTTTITTTLPTEDPKGRLVAVRSQPFRQTPFLELAGKCRVVTVDYEETQMKPEGKTTSAVEEQTSKVPSLAYFGLAVGAMVASATLVLTGRKEVGNFVGQWAPSILIIGLYNKVAKHLAARPAFGT